MATEPESDEATSDEFLSVGQAAQLVGVSAGTLRLWESQGLLDPSRRENGQRYYTPSDILRLRQIRHLRLVNKLNAAAIRQLVPTTPRAEESERDALVEIRARGAELRAARKRLGLTLKQAAKRSGFSVSFISSVERGVAGASPSAVARLLEAYRADGLRFGDDFAIRVHRQGAGGRAIEHAGVRDEWLSDRPGLLEPVIKTIEPGASSEGIYEHEGEEFHLVLEGSLHFWLAGELHVLEPGDSIHFPSQIPHRWQNPGAVITRMLGVTTEVGLWSLGKRTLGAWLGGPTASVPLDRLTDEEPQ